MSAIDLWTSTDGGVLLAAAVLLPFVGMLLGLLLGGRWLQRVAFVLMPLGLGLALAIAMAWFDAEGPLVYLLGGWSPPLGIALRADGASVAMLLAVAGVVCGIGAVRARRLRPGARGSRVARSLHLLAAAAGGVGLAEPGLRQRRPVHAVRRAGTADLRRRAAGVPGRQRRDAARRAALHAVRAVRLGAVPAGRGAAVRRLRHAGHAAAGRRAAARADRHGRARADDRRAAGQDGAVPAAHLAAAGARRRAGRGQRGAVGAGHQGLVVPGAAAVAGRDARRGQRAGRAAAGRAGCGGHRRRQRGRAAPAAAEAAGGLFDGGADRLPVPAVPAGLRRRRRHGAARDGGHGRRAAGHRACHRQGRHVHGRRAGVRAPGPRPHRRAGRRGARAAAGGGGFLDRRAGIDGRGAERRLSGEEAAAGLGRRIRPVVVDAGCCRAGPPSPPATWC